MWPKFSKSEPPDLTGKVPGFSELALERPFRPALRDDVQRGDATALSRTKIESLPCPKNRAKK